MYELYIWLMNIENVVDGFIIAGETIVVCCYDLC